MKNILARGGVEFVAVFLGIALSLWVDEYQKSKEARELNNQILKRLHDNLEADSTDAFGIIKLISFPRGVVKKSCNGVIMVKRNKILLIYLFLHWQ